MSIDDGDELVDGTDARGARFNPYTSGECKLTGAWISPRPQDGYVVRKTSSSPTASRAEYWCVAWQSPYVKGVAFSVRVVGGEKLYAKATSARYMHTAGSRPSDLGNALL